MATSLRQSRPSFNVLIVGCGLCGLASALALNQAGHDVTVFERAPELKEVGAGIQCPPNATRLFEKWGILDEIRARAVQPEKGRSALKAPEGSPLVELPFTSETEDEYGTPYLVIHRAQLLKVLLSECRRRGVDIRTDSEVVDVDFDKPALKLADGTVWEGDLILGADGDKSVCRRALLGRTDMPKSTGDEVYRIALPRRDVDPSHPSYEVTTKPGVDIWIGPDAHAVSYLLKDDILNVVIIRRMQEDREVMYGPQPADLSELRKYFAHWDEALLGLMDVDESDCTKWTLTQIDPIDQWRHDNGKFALVGDAAHAMLPYLAQGAAMGFEDAGVLGAIFSRLKDKSQIPQALQVFEKLRIPRVAEVRNRTMQQKALYSLDGEAKAQRDAKLAQGVVPGSPSGWNDLPFQRWLWGHDATTEGELAWLNTVRESRL